MRIITACLLIALGIAAHAGTIEAVTLASQPHEVFVPVREAATALGWKLEYDSLVELIHLRGRTLSPFAPRLSNGAWLISLKELESLGATVAKDQVSSEGNSFGIHIGEKKVAVDLTKQILWAWQGDRLVYEWKISSGAEGKGTPAGDFKALEKEKMHISKLYGSPMPFSVHIHGNIYIHGSDSFSNTPGSHGCIRLPVMETRNIAEEFFNWIEIGTPVRVSGKWRKGED